MGALMAVEATDTPQLASCVPIVCKRLRTFCRASGAYICPIGARRGLHSGEGIFKICMANNCPSSA